MPKIARLQNFSRMMSRKDFFHSCRIVQPTLTGNLLKQCCKPLKRSRETACCWSLAQVYCYWHDISYTQPETVQESHLLKYLHIKRHANHDLSRFDHIYTKHDFSALSKKGAADC